MSNDIELCFASKICDESTTWLIEIENRMSNLNRSQKSLFWTNWIQLNLRRSKFLIDSLTKRRENIFVCMWLKLFLNCLSAFSSKYDFLIVSKRFAQAAFIFLNLMFCIIDDFWCLMSQYWNWLVCYCWSDQKYVNKCFFLYDVSFFDDVNLID